MRAGIHTLGDLVNKSEEELLQIRNMGLGGVYKIESELQSLNLFLKENEYATLKRKRRKAEKDITLTPIGRLDLSRNVYNALVRNGIHAVEDLSNYSAEDIYKFYGISKKRASELIDRLREFNVPLEYAPKFNTTEALRGFIQKKGINSTEGYIKYYYENVNKRKYLLGVLGCSCEWDLLSRVYPDCPSEYLCKIFLGTVFGLRDPKDISMDVLIVFDKEYISQEDKEFISYNVPKAVLSSFVSGKINLLNIINNSISGWEWDLVRLRFKYELSYYNITRRILEDVVFVDGVAYKPSSNTVEYFIDKSLSKIRKGLGLSSGVEV